MSVVPVESMVGKVVGTFLTGVADGSDEDRLPEVIPASGTILLIPMMRVHRLVNGTTATVYRKDRSGTLGPDGSVLDENGEEGIWLFEGIYTAIITLNTGVLPKFTIKVTPEHTDTNPLDLTLAMPLKPEADMVPVPSLQTKIDAEAAAARAEIAAQRAEAASEFLVLRAEESVPPGTAEGTVIIRTSY